MSDTSGEFSDYNLLSILSTLFIIVCDTPPTASTENSRGVDVDGSARTLYLPIVACVIALLFVVDMHQILYHLTVRFVSRFIPSFIRKRGI